MANVLTPERLRATLAAEFRAAVEAGVGAPVTASAAPAPPGPGWSTEIAVSGGLDGRLAAWIDDDGVQALARAMTRLDEAVDPAVAGEMLREFFGQAAAVTSVREGFEGLSLEVGTPTRGDMPADAGGVALALNGARAAWLSLSGTLVAGAAAGAAGSDAQDAADAARAYQGNLAALLDVDLPLVVRFARTEMTLRALSQLGPGAMVDMGRSPDAPVQLLIGSQVVAEGEVVVVTGNYGVRITSLVSPADRLRAMDL